MEQRIRLNAEVKCDDGDAGWLDRLVVDPTHRRVTHLVVRLHDGSRKVVPESALAETHLEWLKLGMDRATLQAQPDFVTTDYLLPSSEWEPPAGYTHADLLWPSHQAPTITEDVSPGPLPIEHHLVLPGEWEVTRGMRVFCSDKECGTVAEVLMDPENGKAHGFLVRRGFLFLRDVAIPMGWIAGLGADGLHLKMTARQVEELAREFPVEPA